MPLVQCQGMECIQEEEVDTVQRRVQLRAADEVAVQNLEYITI